MPTVDPKLQYLYFARAYLVLASLGIKELNGYLDSGTFINPIANVEPEDQTYEKKYLLAPILYNIKHAIEIYLKTISKLGGIEPQNKHDLFHLYSAIKPKLSKRSQITSQIAELEELIKKYHGNRFITSKISGDIELEDEYNDLFRYPESKTKLTLDFYEIFPRFTQTDLTEINNDVERLFELFNEIGMDILGIKLSDEELKTILKEYYLTQSMSS